MYVMSFCEKYRNEFAKIKELKDELASKFSISKQERDYPVIIKLKEEIAKKAEDLFDRIDPHRISLRERIAKENNYFQVGEFFDGVAIATTAEKKFFIDRSGKKISEEYDDVSNFSDGLALVKNGVRYSYIDKAGNRVGKEYVSAQSFSEGFAVVSDGINFFHIDVSGKKLSREIFSYVGDFSEGLAKVISDGEGFYIDKLGSRVFGDFDDYTGSFSEGFAVATAKDAGYYFMDKQGKDIFPKTGYFEYAEDFSEGLALVKLEREYYFMDKSGNFVLSLGKVSAGKFSEGLSRVICHNSEGRMYSYFIDKTGKQVGEDYDAAENFSEGVAWVKKGKEVFCIDRYGRPRFVS